MPEIPRLLRVQPYTYIISSYNLYKDKMASPKNILYSKVPLYCFLIVLVTVGKGSMP